MRSGTVRPAEGRARRGTAGRVATRAFSALFASALLAIAGPAQAHTDLQTGRPSAGETVTRPLEAVELVFTGPLVSNQTTIDVTAPSGRTVTAGEPRAAALNVVQVLSPLTEAGRYRVAYRVVSIDGHPITGSYTFVVAKSATVASDEEEPSSSSPVNPASAGAAAVVVIGLLAVLAALRRRSAARTRSP